MFNLIRILVRCVPFDGLLNDRFGSKAVVEKYGFNLESFYLISSIAIS
jgi:hypothetical protein